VRTPLVVPVAAAAAFAAASTRLPVGDSDVFWHLVLGHQALRGAVAVPEAVSGLSWTALGFPGSSDQWLGQALLAKAFDAGDWRGIVAVRAIAVALLVGLIVYAALRERPARPLAALVAALPAIGLSWFVWTERPELFGLVCFAAFSVLLRAGRNGSLRALYAIPPLIVVWANLHGSFALGVVLVLLVAIEGAIAEPLRRRQYVATAIASLVASLITPAGLGTWTAPGFHLLHPPREIQEWSVPDVTTLPGAIFAVAIFATLATALFARTRVPRDGVVLVPVLFLSLIASRLMPLFAIAAVPYLAAHGSEVIAELAARLRPRTPRRAVGAPRLGRAADLAVAAIAAVTLWVAVATGVGAPALGGFPTAALPLLDPGPGLLNQYDWGGFLIWSAPKTPVFVDGRLIPYLGAVLDDYVTVVGVHPGWRDVIARRHIRQILVRPTDPVAVRARALGWPIRASSETFILIDVP